MALKQFKPTTPGQRGLVLIDRSGLWKGKPEKWLTEGLRGHGGRNNLGALPPAGAAAGTSGAIGSSISSAPSSTCRRRSSGWSTIPIAAASSP